TSDALIIGTLAFPLQNIVYCFFHVWICQLVFPYIREHLYIYIPATAIICSGLFYLAYRLFSPILKESEPPLQEDTKKSKITNSVLYVIFVFFLIYYQAILNQGPAFLNHISWISGVLACVLILGFQYNFINALVYAGKTKNMEQLLKNNEHYYLLSKEHIAIINRKCHDLKHQLKVLRTVSEEERNEYIDEAEKSIIFYQDLIHTDNEALNTILAEKGLFCRENKISFHCSVDDANLSFIRVSDLYALMGNAIDNAIEYTKKQTDENLRSISLRIDQKKNFIGIQITNPISEEDARMYENQSKSILSSSKSDKHYHGFGMKSIRYLCEKYNGSMEYSTSHGLFTMQIVLPTNQIPS
nr:ATP-binding protein [Lachnospiraceae bacterium]